MANTSVRARPLPQRTCVACSSNSAKRDFIRIVRTPAGPIEPDPTGKKPGRGAYVCGEAACWNLALNKGRLERSLKVTLSKGDAANLAAYAESLAGGAQ